MRRFRRLPRHILRRLPNSELIYDVIKSKLSPMFRQKILKLDGIRSHMFSVLKGTVRCVLETPYTYLERGISHYASNFLSLPQPLPRKRKCIELEDTASTRRIKRIKLSIEKPSPFINSWESLPDNILESLYCLLGDNDRFNMALVCQNWRRMFTASSLWRCRNFTINVDGGQSKEDCGKAMMFVRNHGQHLRELSLTIDPEDDEQEYSEEDMETLGNSCSELFRVMTAKKLNVEHFRFLGAQMEAHWSNNTAARVKFIAALSHFLQRLPKLLGLEMSTMRAPMNEGTYLLHGVGRGAANTLNCLDIRAFIEEGDRYYLYQPYHRAISEFKALKNLYINYNYINHEILTNVSSNCSTLAYLSIKVSRGEPRTHCISGTDWLDAKTKCPDLEVKFAFEDVCDAESISEIALPEVPVTKVTFESTAQIEDEEEYVPNLNECLVSIANTYSQKLEKVSLKIKDYNGEDITEGIVYILNCCKDSFCKLRVAANCVDTDVLEEAIKQRKDSQGNVSSIISL